MYPWQRMEIGDSIFSKKNKGSALKAAAYAQNKKCRDENLGYKLTARHVNGGVRVWKVAKKNA